MNDTTPTLLYIDDDKALARLVERGLTRLGFKVVHAASGTDGLDRLAQGGIDVVARIIAGCEVECILVIRAMNEIARLGDQRRPRALRHEWASEQTSGPSRLMHQCPPCAL